MNQKICKVWNRKVAGILTNILEKFEHRKMHSMLVRIINREGVDLYG